MNHREGKILAVISSQVKDIREDQKIIKDKMEVYSKGLTQLETKFNEHAKQEFWSKLKQVITAAVAGILASGTATALTRLPI